MLHRILQPTLTVESDIMKLDELSELFEQTITIQDAAEQQRFIDASCETASDRKKLSDLVKAHQTTCHLIDSKDPVADAVGSLDQDTPCAQEGDLLGNYRLLQEIGEGGMGLVFMADQLEPIRRRVAVKIIKSEASSRHILARFEAEREALARLDHPNITRILDAGVTATGLPYFVMELVRGDSLIDYCDQQKLSIRQRIELLEKVCMAVHHAHQKGILHRDIKPANIMVTMHDGVPVPKVIDFGIAKALDQPLTQRTLFTRYGDMVGTPQYMSPEQAEKSGLDIDLRTDVFSLGVVLYEMLTGTTPIEENALKDKGILGILETVRDCDTESPSFRVTRTLSIDQDVAVRRNTNGNLLKRSISGELDWITLKALSKDRGNRYDSAAAMAKDLRRYLDGDSVEAAAPTFFYLVRKVYQRHRTICFSITICAFLLVATSLVSLAWAVSNQRLQKLATNTAEELAIKSGRLENLNAELKTARDKARQAEARALALANEKKQKLVQERAVKQMILQAVGLKTSGSGMEGEVQIINKGPLANGLAATFQLSPEQFEKSIPLASNSKTTFSMSRPKVSIQVLNDLTADLEVGSTQNVMSAIRQSSEHLSKHYGILITEYRKEFGTSHALVAACLIDSCEVELAKKSVNWSVVESRCREAKAILTGNTTERALSEQKRLFLQLKADSLLALAMIGQDRTNESTPLLENIKKALKDGGSKLTQKQRSAVQKLLAEAELPEKP